MSLLLALLAATVVRHCTPRADDTPRLLDTTRLTVRAVDPLAASRFFPVLQRKTSRMQYDPVAWVVLRPDREQSFDWPEHPAGRIRFRTNADGLRDDEPLPPRSARPRVLVLGDSHTEGMVDNRETFAKRLEALLAERAAPGLAPEVLNAAVGGTGPHNYLGQARRLAHLQPDLVIASIYLGNDFSNALALGDFLAGRDPPVRSARQREALLDAAKRWPALVPQGFNQAVEFRAWPEAAERALRLVGEVLVELHGFCTEQSARLLVLLLPSKPHADGDDDRATIEALLKRLSLKRNDLARELELGARLAASLSALGIPVLDATAVLADSREPCYWRADHHLSVHGHDLVARALRDPVAELLSR